MGKILFFIKFHSNFQGMARQNYFKEVVSGKLLCYHGEEKRILQKLWGPFSYSAKEKMQVDLIRDECCFIFNSMIVLLRFMPGEVISTSLKFNWVRMAWQKHHMAIGIKLGSDSNFSHWLGNCKVIYLVCALYNSFAKEMVFAMDFYEVHK